MYKPFLLLAIIFSCGFLGIIKSQTYRQRLKNLYEIQSMLQILDSEINYTKDPLPLIFRRMSRHSRDVTSLLVSNCCNYMKKNLDFSICWKKSIEDVSKSSALNKTDLEILAGLGNQLGKSGASGQSEVIALINEKIRQQIKEASSEINSKGKMYGGLGFSIGIVIAVLLI